MIFNDPRHPFSPNYRGRIAHECCNPRYPNRVQPPKPDAKRRLCAGEVPKGKALSHNTKDK